MALKVAAHHSRQTPKSSTDLVRFLYPDKAKQIQLSLFCNPRILVFPTPQADDVKLWQTMVMSLFKTGNVMADIMINHNIIFSALGKPRR